MMLSPKRFSQVPTGPMFLNSSLGINYYLDSVLKGGGTTPYWCLASNDDGDYIAAYKLILQLMTPTGLCR